MKGKLRIWLLTLLVWVMMTSVALGAEGVVVHQDDNCNYVVVKEENKYAVIELNSKTKLKKRDRISGSFQSNSMGFVQHVRTGEEIRVWYENYPVSKQKALQLYRQYCKLS